MKIKNKKLKQFILEILGTIAGAILMAIAISLLLLPNQLSTGGFSGIATILYYFLKVPMGITILVLNIPFFILAGYKLGKKFVLKTFIGTTTLSIFIDIIDKIQPLTQDRFLACIYGGVIIGLGTALILKSNSATGGSDLIGAIVKQYNPNIKTGQIITIVDGIIVGLNVMFFKEIEVGLYSAIAIYLMGKIIDIFFEGIYFTKLLIIISNKSQEISDEIGEKIGKGTTGLYGKGMYKDEQKLVLLCAASRGDVIRVKQVAKKIDPESFIIVTNAREVMGLGFK